MTQDEIIEMARQAGIRFRVNVFHSGYCDGVHGDELEAFAKLVAAKAFQDGYEKGKKGFMEAIKLEREDLCNAMEDQDTWDLYDPAATAIKVIKARGEA
jgi:ABC-type tungstate transport system permease subunit